MPTDSVAYRLAVLCADPAGVVPGGLLLHDQAVRSALIIDLAYQGRLRLDVDTSYLDTTTTGDPPTDALLHYVELYPAGSMQDTIAYADVGVLDVLDPSRIGLRRRDRKRALHLDPRLVYELRSAVDMMAETGRAPPPTDAALTALAGILRFVTRANQPALLARCGLPRGLVADCCSHLDALREKYSWVEHVQGGGG